MMKYLIYILIMLANIANVHSQDLQVPINVQVPIFNKIFHYERNLVKKSKKEIYVGIVYQNHLRKSLHCRNECKKQFTGVYEYIGDNKIKIVDINITDPSDLNIYYSHVGLDIIIVCPLKQIDINEITNICKSKNIISFALTPAYFHKYTFTATIEKEMDKSRITINLKSAKEEGANFSSKLLKLSRVVNK